MKSVAYIGSIHGIITLIGLFVAMPILSSLDSFSSGQPDLPAIYSIVEMSFAVVSIVIVFTTMYYPKSISFTIGGSFWIILALSQLVLLYLRAYNTGFISDIGLVEEAGCRDSSFVGCPIARLLSSGNTIESIGDCRFNAFDLDNINTGEGSSQLIDWSRSEERRVGKEGRSRWSPYH